MSQRTAVELIVKLLFCRPELFPFSSCIMYAVVMAMVALDRVSLKKRVVDAPEILTVIEEVPNLSSFLNSLYYCRYSEFFQVGCFMGWTISCDHYANPECTKMATPCYQDVQ